MIYYAALAAGVPPLLMVASAAMRAPIPVSEKTRFARVREYCTLDTPPEPEFDRLSRIAAVIFKTPVVLLSFVNENRQLFKPCYGAQCPDIIWNASHRTTRGLVPTS